MTGSANTGRGGDGAIASAGKSGGSGTVVIQFPEYYSKPSTLTGNPTYSKKSGIHEYKFTGAGSIKWG